MTVKELIEELNTYPKDCTVFAIDYNDNTYVIDKDDISVNYSNKELWFELGF